MPELKCTVQTCAHNKEFYCDLNSIMVNGESAKESRETCCASFEERKGDYSSNVVGKASPTSNIDCKAVQCMYNDDCKCHAGKISVEGSCACKEDETLCATFKCCK